MIAAIKSLFTRRKENPCSRICGIKPKSKAGIMTNEEIIPSIVLTRWQQAIAKDSLSDWGELRTMINTMRFTAECTDPDSPVTDRLRTLADVATERYSEHLPETI